MMDWIFSRRSGARVSDVLEYELGKVLVLENDRLSVVCQPGKGADIVSFYNKQACCECLVRPYPIPPNQKESSVTGAEFERAMFVWPEMFPTASAYADYCGRPQPYHGEARYQRWRYQIVEDSPERVSVKLSARMQWSPFELTRTMTIARDSATLILDEPAPNLGECPLPVIWGHHPTFGAPMLSGQCRIHLPKCTLMDDDESALQIAPPASGVGRMFYATNLASGWYGVYDTRHEFGVGMRWDKDLFKILWIWQDLNAECDAPLYSDLYALAVEPVTGLPASHPRYGEFGPITIEPGKPISTRLEMFLFDHVDELGE